MTLICELSSILGPIIGLFPYALATDVGAELFHNESDAAKGFAGDEIVVIPGKVQLELLSEDESFAWEAIVGFAKFESSTNECSILGHTDCLEFFTAIFDGTAETVELLREDPQ